MFDRVIRKLHRFLPSVDDHLSCEQLADLFCGDSSLLEGWAMRRHLAGCAACRLRKQHLEGPLAEQMLGAYRESMDAADMVPSAWRRSEFLVQLELQQLRGSWSRDWNLVPNGWASWLSRPVPVVLTGALTGVIAGASLFSFLSRDSGLKITANALLVRAEEWDQPHTTSTPGVVHQTVQIKSSHQLVKRSVYWDVQGKRHPKPGRIAASEDRLRLALDQAGVDWNRPISASAYQDWHDHQHVRTDHIARSGVHLLTLTTTVPDGVVSEESLTVRDTDFHPVQRRVGFRDHETVEVVELDFSVLPWSAIDTGIFDPVLAASESSSLPVATALHSLQVLEAPTPEQLDEAELSARLILNRHQADSGEQIEIRRLPLVVEVDGLVETEERKREMTADLTTIPRLKVSIQSVAHLNDRRSPDSHAQLVDDGRTVLADRPSPLESYLRANGATLDDANAFAEKIFKNALAISHESAAIADLKTRFVPDKRMPVLAMATLAELLYSHRERLDEALHQERALLAEVGAKGLSDAEPSSWIFSSLTGEASRNFALVRELTQTGALNPHRAEEIFAEIARTVDRITGAADEAYRASQQTSASSASQTGSVH
jgi:hypothetical protein